MTVTTVAEGNLKKSAQGPGVQGLMVRESPTHHGPSRVLFMAPQNQMFVQPPGFTVHQPGGVSGGWWWWGYHYIYVGNGEGKGLGKAKGKAEGKGKRGRLTRIPHIYTPLPISIRACSSIRLYIPLISFVLVIPSIILRSRNSFFRIYPIKRTHQSKMPTDTKPVRKTSFILFAAGP